MQNCQDIKSPKYYLFIHSLQVNEDPDYVYGYNLGITHMFDIQNMTDLRSRILETFIKKTPFTVGPYSSQSSYIAGKVNGSI